MPRKKKAPFKDYEGSKLNDKHLRLTNDMLISQNFMSLSNSAKVVYVYMKLWACGKDEFQYPKSLAEKYMNGKTFLKAKDELIEKGFIDFVSGNKFAHIPNTYKFSCKWKYYKIKS
jgi:hypothetical protein